MSNSKSVWELKLHEQMCVSEDERRPWLATRVPGGWIYAEDIVDKGRIVAEAAVFVPYTDRTDSQE